MTKKYDDNNVFAKIIKGEIIAKKIYEDDILIVIQDIKPEAEIHLLAIPKNQYTDYADFVTKASVEEKNHYFTKIAVLAKTLGFDEDGYKLITNKGAKVGQQVFHFHTHILSGKIY